MLKQTRRDEQFEERQKRKSLDFRGVLLKSKEGRENIERKVDGIKRGKEGVNKVSRCKNGYR
jgi:hypothetical protein